MARIKGGATTPADRMSTPEEDGRSGNGSVVAVFGSTGTAGGGAVRACLLAPRVSEVRAVARRALALADPKLRQVICTDFRDLAPIETELRGVDTCLFCLGASVRNVRGEAEYREIHVTYALVAARALLAQSPRASFVYLSGAGASNASRMMWARVKAEAEAELARVGLARLINVRPGGILPPEPAGLERWLLAPLLGLVPSLGIGAEELGRAMLRAGLDGDTGPSGSILENRSLKEIAGRPG